MVTYASNSSYSGGWGKAIRPAWAREWVQGQPGKFN